MVVDERIMALFDRFIVYGLIVPQENTAWTGGNVLCAKKR